LKLDAVYVNGIARATRFDPSNLEKVIRLRQLLIEFQKHPFLQGRLVLKGGTAVNLFYLQLVRLSVDIDLNYIGQLDREEMLRERDCGQNPPSPCPALESRKRPPIPLKAKTP
jgi:predicted nucleotidyltransferase component of viral defense system